MYQLGHQNWTTGFCYLTGTELGQKMDKEEQQFRLMQHKHMRKSLQNVVAEGEVSKNKNKKIGQS